MVTVCELVGWGGEGKGRDERALLLPDTERREGGEKEQRLP